MSVDIKHVDPYFLNSEERLAHAMFDLIAETGATLLSYNCRSVESSGVSCVGVVSRSHVSIRTWPEEGIVIIDLFASGAAPLLPILPVLEGLFAIPVRDRGGGIDEGSPAPGVLWSHKLRGFREGFGPYRRHENPSDQEFGEDFLRRRDLDGKVRAASGATDFQRVDVVELIDPRLRSSLAHERSLRNDASYESLHRDLYRPDKILFLDGVK